MLASHHSVIQVDALPAAQPMASNIKGSKHVGKYNYKCNKCIQWIAYETSIVLPNEPENFTQITPGICPNRAKIYTWSP